MHQHGSDGLMRQCVRCQESLLHNSVHKCHVSTTHQNMHGALDMLSIVLVGRASTEGIENGWHTHAHHASFQLKRPCACACSCGCDCKCGCCCGCCRLLLGQHQVLEQVRSEHQHAVVALHAVALHTKLWFILSLLASAHLLQSQQSLGGPPEGLRGNLVADLAHLQQGRARQAQCSRRTRADSKGVRLRSGAGLQVQCGVEYGVVGQGHEHGMEIWCTGGQIT